MNGKVLVALFALCAVVAVSEGVKCYTCTRLEWTVFYDGKNDEECEYPVDKKAPTEEECDFCAMDMRNETFDWIGRHCIKGAECSNGTYSQEHPAFDWVDSIPFVDKDADNFDTTRVCCTTDLCNGMDYNPDGANSLQLASGLLAAILFSVYYNFRQ